ncbi:hypothetical protein JTE90_012354 [Oedothorax gibbosus]|uniref:RRM domain-containing protein n=1 Tax=Oedothorax gibbosus TaxID=931172 RepID=A0AAV6V6Z2_9ARAC|nr:hypothetical protein JTE90_012354 [Oedothorax gibbosus]
MMAGKGGSVKPLNALKKIGKNSPAVTPKVKKPKQKKRKRLIIRNLSFKVEEDDLKKIFSEFGTVKEAIIPKKEDGKKRGFGFVEFEDTKSLIKAMKSMNWKEIHGRKVAVDFAVDKNTYQSKVKSMKQENKDTSLSDDDIKPEVQIKDEPISDDEEEESEEEEEKKLNAFLKDFYSGSEKLTKSPNKKRDISSGESSSEEESESEDSDSDNDSPVPKKKIKRESDDDASVISIDDTIKKKDSRDVSEGKTVFLRNVSFATTQDSLKEAMAEYGDCVYSLLCMDPYTDHPKGTAFVKFKEKESADKLVKESFGEPGVVVDGRKLTCSLAMSREDVSHVGDDTKKPKDKRNLNLLRVGLIMRDSKESEGVSPADMAKRAQLEIVKKQKLRNVNFFVSDKRLMIHNLPKTYTDEKLRKLLKKFAESGAVITEARVMKEFKKIDDSGAPLSKGYGFASFSKHEDALKVLNELNNNPSVFTALKRPIVEFSVENKVALLSQERRKEKMKTRNKKRTEEKKERQLAQSASSTLEEPPDVPKKKKNRRKKKNVPVKNETDNQKEDKRLISEEASSESPKKKKNRRKKKNIAVKNETNAHKEDIRLISEEASPNKSPKKKNKKSRPSTMEKKKLSNGKSQQNMTNLVNKFKDKLKNKIT